MRYLIFFLFSFINHRLSDGNDEFGKTYSNDIISCSGSENAYSKMSDEIIMDHMRKMYENCTRVYGNLEITHISKSLLEGKTPEEAFSFLDDIQEVTGYVLIFNNYFDYITLKNLEIIWGDKLLFNMTSLEIAGNANLRYVNMPKLRSVESGIIGIHGNPYLCSWNYSVSTSELIGKTDENRTIFYENFAECTAEDFICDPSCGQNCWGPGKNMCQIVYRSICPSTCPSGMCFLDAKNATNCCDEACTAGCFGEGKNECIACKKLEQDSKCVEKCNGLTDYDRVLRLTVKHPDPRYTYDRYCVKRCPEQTLIQGDHCVVKCTEGYWHDPELNTRICEKCEGACPKSCELKEPIDASNIKSIENCTLIDGFIVIHKHVFIKHMKWAEDFNVPPVEVEALTVPMLEALSNVSVVTDYIVVDSGENSPHSLKFLRNLAVIEGRTLISSLALSIHNNYNLRELGLKSLRSIKNGGVYIGNNMVLCYVDSIKERLSYMLEGHNKSKYGVKILGNRRQDLCESFGLVCDSQCHNETGCWGKGPEMCVSCLKYTIDKMCINECPKTGYFDDGNKRCVQCHEECLTCRDTTSFNCTTCKNYRIRTANGMKCIKECPVTHFANEAKECLPCSAVCYDFGCTGNGSHVGPGGCNKCMHAQRIKCLGCSTGDSLRCLIAGVNPKDVCKDNNLTNYFIAPGSASVESFECQKCHNECSSCSAYGITKLHQCKCSNFVTLANDGSEYCTPFCEVNSFTQKVKEVNSLGICKQCHALCDQSKSCIGDSPNDCMACDKASVQADGIQECLEQCPLTKRFQTVDKVCHSSDPLLLNQRRKKITIALVLMGVIIFIIILTILLSKCVKYKKRYKQEVEMNLPSLPECDPIDPNLKPNMTRLNIISNEQLAKTAKPLGKGAFGTVYAGYWWPNGKEGSEKVVVAIKVVHDPAGSAQQEMLAEAGIMASMRHENLLRLVGVSLSDGMQLVTPLRPLGSLRDFLIKHHQKLAARDLMLYCFQIASAMEYLFKNRLVHRDLAARNVLVKRTNHVEVTDFGLAKMLEKGKSEIVVGGKVAVKWLALESLKYRLYTHWTDVWAFGITCWEILTFGQTPYPGISPENIRNHLESGNRLEQPNNCTQDVYQTLLQCWLVNPESRPNFIIVKEKFYQYCRAPNLYILDGRNLVQMESPCYGDQRELINELLEDNDFTDPLVYFDEHDVSNVNTTSTLLPPSPTSWQQPQMIGERLSSSDSGRYQTDPVSGDRHEMGMDEGNYLIPKIKNDNEMLQQLYTPVLTKDGETELINYLEYYNDKATNEYYNEMKIPKLSELGAIENAQYFAQTETTL